MLERNWAFFEVHPVSERPKAQECQRTMISRLLAAAALFVASPLLIAGEALTGEVQKQPTN